MKFKQERQELVDGVIETEERYYIGGAEFVDGVMQTFYFPDGRIVLDVESKEIFAQYKIKDHLGNTAVVFQDKDLDDVVIDEEAADAFGLELEVLQRDFYYPFGLSMEGAWIVGSTDDPRMDYRYNGKELSQVTGLLAYGARYYDPAIGRFSGVDPIADQFAFVSPFNYAENSPIANIDLWGLQAFSIHGWQSAGEDWKSPEFQEVNNYFRQLTNNKTFFSHEFSWEKQAKQLRTKEHRLEAARELVDFVLQNRVEGEDITFIGVSDGGNVSLQAANLLYEEHGLKSNIITINTPGSSAECDAENPNENPGINDLIQVSTKGDKVVTGFARAIQNPGKQSNWESIMVNPTVSKNIILGRWGGVIPLESNIPNYKGVHATGNLNLKEVRAANLEKLEPINN